MPIDASIPLGVQQPNMLANLGQVIGTLNSLNEYRHGQMSLQQQSIELQQQQQSNEERKNVIAAVQNDPDFKPGPDGVIDTSKVMPKLMQLAPQTYNQYSQNISKSNEAQTTVNKSLLALGNEGMESLARAVTGGFGKTKSQVEKLLSDAADANGSPAFRGVTNRFLDALASVKDGDQEGVNSLVQSAALRTKSLQEQFNATQGEPSLVDQGTQAQPTIMQSRLTGLAPGAPVGQAVPLGAGPKYEVDSAGNLHRLPGIPPAGARIPTVTPNNPGDSSQQGAWKSSVPSSAPSGLGGWVNNQQARSQLQSAEETKAAQQGALQIPVLRSNINEMFRLVDSGTKFGPGSELFNSALGVGNTITGGSIGKDAASYQTASAILDRIALQQAQALGQTTVSGTQLTANATGTAGGFNKDALKEKLRIIDSQFAAQQAYTQGLVNHVGTGQNQNFANKAAYDAAWTKSLGTDGVDAFRIQSDLSRGDTRDVDALVRATGKPMAYWKKRAMDLDNLTGGGLSGRAAPPTTRPDPQQASASPGGATGGW